MTPLLNGDRDVDCGLYLRGASAGTSCDHNDVAPLRSAGVGGCCAATSHGKIENAEGEKGKQHVAIPLACGKKEQKKTGKTDAAACRQPEGAVPL